MTSEFESLSDLELARQSRAGSLVAFEELVYRYEGRIYGFLFKSCRNVTDARELTQDTFVRAFHNLAQFNSKHSFAPWLFTIARHKLIDRVRSGLRMSDEPVPELADSFNPSDALVKHEDAQNLWDLARRRLPSTQFDALWLRYAEEMSVAEIANALRRTKTHVKVLLFRARSTLGKELGAPTPRQSLRSRAQGRPLTNPASFVPQHTL
jgi:RNA polymerase sigma-70 factor (ECF subfamily)